MNEIYCPKCGKIADIEEIDDVELDYDKMREHFFAQCPLCEIEFSGVRDWILIADGYGIEEVNEC